MNVNAVECLNKAFAADSNAMQALMVNRVPCNRALADDPFVQVQQCSVLDNESFQVGAIGLINAVLAATGQQLVAIMFDDPDDEGYRKVIGFCDYQPEKQ